MTGSQVTRRAGLVGLAFLLCAALFYAVGEAKASGPEARTKIAVGTFSSLTLSGFGTANLDGVISPGE